MKFVNYSAALALLLALSTGSTASEIEIVAELEGSRPGNPTVTPAGRIIFSQQPLDNPDLRVVELMADGSLQPFPNLDWADGPEKGYVGLASVIGIDTTEGGIVWMLDMGNSNTQPKLVAWDSVQNNLHRIIPISKDALLANSFLQDFAIDSKRQKIYIADMTLGNLAGDTKPAFVVVDMITGKSTRVLEAESRLMPEERTVIIDGSPMAVKREDGRSDSLYLGLNPISIDSENEWVYFATINGTRIHRIPAEALANENASFDEKASEIEFFGPKKPSDGMIVGAGSKLYVGDVEESAVAIVTKDGYRTLARDKKLLSWADGFSINKGWLYVTQNQLHLHPVLNEGLAEERKPYHLVRIKLPE